jgi:hypothetical protein
VKEVVVVGRVVGRIAVTVALIAASLAWAGWVFLHTVGDPDRIETVARAVIDDEAARGQVAAALTGQLVDLGPVRAPDERLLDDALSDVLADPRVSENLISAFGAAHNTALGLDDPRSTTIDSSELVDGLRERLEPVAPDVAAFLPDSAIVPDVTLPRYTPPGAARTRNLAEAAVLPLVLASLALIVLAFAVGDRRSVVRRVGIWGIVNGVFWALMPLIVPALAVAIKPDLAEVIRAAVEASSGSVRPAAITLVVVGVVLVGLSFVPQLFKAPAGQQWVTHREPAPVAAQPTVRTTTAPAPAPAPAARPIDTFEPSGASYVPEYEMAGPPPSYTVNVAPTAVTGDVLVTSVAEPADPWAAYFPSSPPERP